MEFLCSLAKVASGVSEWYFATSKSPNNFQKWNIFESLFKGDSVNTYLSDLSIA